MFNKQIYVERLLENENLTADLEDDEANWLIEWGVAQINIVTDGLTEEDAADEKVTALMTFMRYVSRTVARRNRRTLEELADALDELDSLYVQTFDRMRSTAFDDCIAAASRLQQSRSLDALQFLVEWLKSR